VYDPHLVPDYWDVERKLGSPFIAKPCDVGSTIGLSLVRSASEYEVALEEAFRFSDRLLLEEFIDGFEVTVGLFRLGGDFLVLPPIYVVKPDRILTMIRSISQVVPSTCMIYLFQWKPVKG